MKKLSIFVLSYSAILIPTTYCFALPQTFKDLVNGLIVQGLLQPIPPILISAAVIVFIWGVYKFVISDSSTEKAEGKQFMIYGIIGIFLMVSLWALVGVLVSTFRLDNSPIQVRPVNIPAINAPQVKL